VPVPPYHQFEGQPLPLLQISLLTTFYQFNTGAASLTHLSHDSKAKTDSCNSPLLWSPTLLRQRGTPNHFLMYELINASSISTVVKGTSYTVSGHSNLGSRSNWKLQSFSLPGRAQLFMLFNPSNACRLSAPTQTVSSSYHLYHLPRLFTGFSETVGIASPLMKNVYYLLPFL